MTRHLPNAEGAPAGYIELEAAAPWERGPPPEQPRSEAPKFVLERWRDIRFDGGEEWAIKRILPRVGLAAIYGKPGSLKSFVAAHIGLSAAQEWPWAGRRVARCAALYIAAEGAAGLRKRKAGYVKAYPELPPDVPFSLISAAPNLGADPGDLPALIAAIENAGVSPGLIILDTLAQTLGSADGRTTRHAGYSVSQRVRKRIEEAFGWIKTIAGQEKTKFRGRERVGWAFTFAAAAYNLARLPKLMAGPT